MRLQFISSNLRGENLYTEIEEVLSAGVNWIQLRIKNILETDYLREANRVKEIVDNYSATLIINDNVNVAKELGVGVHIGKNDMPLQAARIVLGENAIIGATANTTEDIINLKEADYIGLGPLNYTKTKQNLSPVLGIEGLTEILADLGEMSLNPKLTLVGGIKLEDLQSLKILGIASIAVSSLISSAENKEKIIKEIMAYGYK